MYEGAVVLIDRLEGLPVQHDLTLSARLRRRRLHICADQVEVIAEGQVKRNLWRRGCDTGAGCAYTGAIVVKGASVDTTNMKAPTNAMNGFANRFVAIVASPNTK